MSARYDKTRIQRPGLATSTFSPPPAAGASSRGDSLHLIPIPTSIAPGTVTVTDNEIVISGWTVRGANADALEVYAIKWAMDRLSEAQP